MINYASHRNLNFPLRSYFTCEVCGEHITGSTSRGRNGTYYAYYHCKTECPTRVPQEDAHQMFSDRLGELQINSNVKELFANYLVESVHKNEGNKKEQLEKKETERQAVQNRIQEIEDRFANKDISSESFNSMTTRYISNLMNINADIEAFNTKDDSIAGFIDDGLNMLLNLNKLFLEADYDGKRILAGSLFSGKIILANDGVRNTGLNEVAECLTRNDKAFKGFKKVQAAKISSLYGCVPPSRSNMNELLEDTRDLARIWDLYGHLLKEAYISQDKSTK